MSVVIPSLRAAIAVPPWAKNDLWRRARAVPSLDLRFADNKSLVDAVTGALLVTFNRASSGTFTDSAGVLQTAATDVPRFDHSPITGESLGLLVEEQRTNLLLRSEELDNASWLKFNSGVVAPVVTSNQSVAPSGVMTADKIELPAVNSAGFSSIVYQVPTQAFSTSHTFSCYLRGEVGGEKVWLQWTDNITRARTLCTLTTSWQRFSLSYTTSASGAQYATIGVDLRDPSQTATPAQTFYAWGAQLEAGATPSTYIPTTTAAVTRSADVASITGTNFSSWYRQDEGTVFAAGVSNGANGAGLFTLEDGSAAEYSRMGVGFSLLNFVVSKASGSQVDVYSTGTSFVFGSPFRGVAAYGLNNVGLSLNGGSAQVDTAADMPSAANVLRIGFGKYATYTNGPIKRLTFWPQRLANSTLQTLTQ